MSAAEDLSLVGNIKKVLRRKNGGLDVWRGVQIVEGKRKVK